jgi:hypothetical protein
VERCFFRSDCWRKLIRFSSDSVVCGECPSEAKQWTAGGEEEDPGYTLTILFVSGAVRWQGHSLNPCGFCRLVATG